MKHSNEDLRVINVSKSLGLKYKSVDSRTRYWNSESIKITSSNSIRFHAGISLNSLYRGHKSKLLKQNTCSPRSKNEAAACRNLKLG